MERREMKSPLNSSELQIRYQKKPGPRSATIPSIRIRIRIFGAINETRISGNLLC